MVLAVVTGLGALVASWLAAGWVLRLSANGRLMDIPNARSAHQTPTPRGGGIGVVLGFGLASLVLWRFGWIATGPLAAVVGGGMAVAGIGLVDDFGHVAIRWRLLVQVGAVCLGLALLLPPAAAAFPAGWLLAAVGWVWLINLYNFMDGIDGLAAVEAVTVMVAAAVILISTQAFGLAVWAGTLAAACAGFLFWNWPPARIFMGDVGSGYLGYVLGVLALAGGESGAISPWSWAILPAVFVSDATLTLLRRMWRRERWWRPHSAHAYQHLARRYGHRVVTLAVAAVNLFWLLPWAWLAASDSARGGLWLALAYGPLVVVAFRAGAGLPPAGRK